MKKQTKSSAIAEYQKVIKQLLSIWPSSDMGLVLGNTQRVVKLNLDGVDTLVCIEHNPKEGYLDTNVVTKCSSLAVDADMLTLKDCQEFCYSACFSLVVRANDAWKQVSREVLQWTKATI